MIIIDEQQSPSSPNERSPLKGGDHSPAIPYNAAAPPPPYAAAPTAAVSAPPVPSYQAIADQNSEQEDIESGGFWHHRGSHRGRWRGGRGAGPGRGGGRHGGHEGSSPNPRRSTFRRFMRAFLVALIVIIIWGAFLDSVDMIFRTNRSRQKHGLLSGPRWLVTWYQSPGTVAPTPCAFPEQSIPAMPGRVLPIRYPPVSSQVVTPPTPIRYSNVGGES